MACKPIVAPLVGAWIEICQYSVCCEELSVAPLVGAWIEIDRYWFVCRRSSSLPSWERGLKWSESVSKMQRVPSLPSWERGLKSVSGCTLVAASASLPSWERGLKWCYHRRGFRSRWSLPSWERGLKSVRAWAPVNGSSRSPRGSVDWNISVFIRTASNLLSLPSRERGLKCTDDGDNLFFQHGRSPCGSDHWNRKDNRISCTMWLHRRRISNWVRRLGKVIGQRKRIWKPYFGETEWHRKNTRWKTDIWVKIFIGKKMETICHFGCKKRTWKHN